MPYLLFITVFLTTAAVQAAETVRQEDAHLHGAAQLNVALDGSTLAMELISPAYNIVGFEHEPGNDEQQHLVDEAMALLKDPLAVFSPSAEAGCVVAESDVDWSLEAADHDKHHDDDHDDHDKDEHHDDDHSAHKDDHDDHDHEESHSEFVATYLFKCATPDSLDHIDTLLFEQFDKMEEIETQVISDRGQTAAELTADSSRITMP